ncbi:hypothetical protein CTAM01_13047 [Colletotrichum tamarilloi]|uniref:Uncharacterized protein n=1 Tax=Colletotrichum tamarilloi TaxID=1209934 RepID=A0ABQ9QT73_9PEZI|nr:uncharacterized protein CTAM01_13047 [Colletotrichum tamarilloi]KAI3528187.1 hypothetical protein CSPX01_16421 [Colletotrichum filicis]KAK1484134.1 hypothetical protein CTAM01_13047 [Colletotrichum tamarilloi]
MHNEYFVQVDEVSLRSVVYKELPSAEANLYVRGHINLVNADWHRASVGLPRREYMCHRRTLQLPSLRGMHRGERRLDEAGSE